MPWFKITTASNVYVFDPERLHVRGDDGRLLEPGEIVAGWRQLGRVEQLPPGTDPEAVMRSARRPLRATRGGNLGFGGRV